MKKVRISCGASVLSATLENHATAAAFFALLPLTLTMGDLFGREKCARLPEPLSEGGERVSGFEVGQIAYWSPGQDLAIFYRHDGKSIPAPGIMVLGTIEGSLDIFLGPDPVEVRIERAG